MLRKAAGNKAQAMVGATGIEPVTPTMSRFDAFDIAAFSVVENGGQMRTDTEQSSTSAQFARGNPTYIYVISAGHSLSKIGITRSIVNRLTQYKIHPPVPVKLTFVHQIPAGDARRIEAAVHKSLAHKRSHGEWFKISRAEATSAIYMEMRARNLEQTLSESEIRKRYKAFMDGGRKQKNYYRNAARRKPSDARQWKLDAPPVGTVAAALAL
jgi:hypothetical protein